MRVMVKNRQCWSRCGVPMRAETLVASTGTAVGPAVGPSVPGARALLPLLCCLLAAVLPAKAADNTVALASYEIVAELAPARHELAAEVVVELPADQAGRSIEFLLTSELDILSASPPIERLPGTGSEAFQGINGSSVPLQRRGGISRYRLQLPDGVTQITLAYRGRIDFPLETQGEEYTRGFRETAGQIGPQGVYLAGSTLWYPYFGDALLRFRLLAKVPPGWQLISQGDGEPGGEDAIASWDSAGPVDEIYLVGGPLLRYAGPAGAAVAEVYLHEPDETLARRYLDATARYIQMYSGLIGPYPYRKFALVENYWETGYGMPSFTLLGPQIIRFPFILSSSYPHEILHNWWGNSVFVDYSSGNWSEGLTAYLADHLFKEQQGQGAEYRRDTLKKYRDFVRAERDFPLSEFRSRHSAATEAVGYGKTLMGFHMLRLRLGDDVFRRSLASFYRKYRGRKARFTDLQSEFEAVSGRSLARFFHEWVRTTGAARLELGEVRVAASGDGYRIMGRLRQSQRQGPFGLAVPLAIATAGGTRIETLHLDQRAIDFEFSSADLPLLLAVDPEFDLFRLLAARETAPSIGQIFGEPVVLAVLPSAADEAERAAYRRLVAAWQGPSQAIEFVTDTDIDELPAERATWLLGRENRLVPALFAADQVTSVALDGSRLVLAGQTIDAGKDSVVVVARHPANVEKAAGWIVVGPRAAFDGLARKLPHYGKYSYLGFRGEEPANVLKGEWQATDSPLRVDLRPASRQREAPVALTLPKRRPLAELPPLFSRERLMQHVDYLAAPEREGRGLGSRGLEEAADYIAARFAEAGLEPGGDEGSYFQLFPVSTGPDGGPHTLRNVVGVLPGADPAAGRQAVLVTAHYDHLGHGWPDERAQAEPGAVYPGADDNASGVAVLIELARAFARGSAQPRTLVFVAFSGEEAGLLGSGWYVQHPTPVPPEQMFAVINLDTVGRLGERPVSILAAESAGEWPHIFRGIGFTTGIATRIVPGASESSDQQSFINAGVPAVQVFTGAHLDYHRPGDTPDKVDADGMVRVATVVREAVAYLAQRPEPLSFTGLASGAGARRETPATAAGNRRRVAFGTVPDFAWQGAGVRVESVVPGSPAERAGILPGDVISALDGDVIGDLAAFSAALKKYQPGDRVRAVIERADTRLELELALAAR